MTEETKQDEAQFKSLGFHQTIAHWVDLMVSEYWANNVGMGSSSWPILRTVYGIVKHTFKFIREENGGDTVDTFQKTWKAIEERYGRSLDETGSLREKDAFLRYDAIMTYLMDSGLIRPATREEAWEDAFIEAIEDKMEREA